MADALIPDWTHEMTLAERHLRNASDAFLLRDWNKGKAELVASIARLDNVMAWNLKREIMEGIK